MTTTISRRGVIALLGGAPLISACSPSASDSSTPTRTEVLRLGAVSAGSQPSSDPHGSLFSEADWVRMTALYDPLIRLDGNGELVAGLASSWTPSQGAKRWVLELRKDAHFSDGRPVTSADVLYSLQRLAQKSAENGGRLGTVDVPSSRARDAHTVVLATSVADAELPRTLAASSFVVPKGTTSFSQPIGSGAFTLETLDAGGARLHANSGWWGGRPHVRTLEIRGFSDPKAMSASIMSGRIDVAMGVDPATARSVAGRKDLQVVRRPAESTTTILMRLDRAPFDKPQVREAIRIAIDREALVQTVHLGHGRVGADLPQPNDPSAPELSPPRRDLARARALLVEAGHPDGLDLELHTTTAYPSMPATAQVVATQLKKVGVRVKVVSHPPQSYWTKIYTKVPFSIGYYGDMPYPVWVRQTALSSAAFNETGWKNEGFDKTFATAMQTTDTERRHALLADMQKEFAREGGVICWGHADGITVARRSVTGLGAAPGLGRLRMDQVRPA